MIRIPGTLTGRTIVITRDQTQASGLVAELERYGARVIVCPTIEISEPASYDRLDEAIDHLYGYDWIVFTSVNGVEYFLRRLQTRGHQASELDELRVCAIDEATSESLIDAHVHVDLVPDQFKAERVFAALENFAGGREALSGLNVLTPRAATARDYLQNALEEAGARVDAVAAYRTVQPDGLNRGRVSAMLAGGAADGIAFTCSSSVRNLAQLFDTNDLGEILNGVVVACINNTTAHTAANYGLRVHIQPGDFTVPALVCAIVEYFGQ